MDDLDADDHHHDHDHHPYQRGEKYFTLTAKDDGVRACIPLTTLAAAKGKPMHMYRWQRTELARHVQDEWGGDWTAFYKHVTQQPPTAASQATREECFAKLWPLPVGTLWEEEEKEFLLSKMWGMADYTKRAKAERPKFDAEVKEMLDENGVDNLRYPHPCHVWPAEWVLAAVPLAEQDSSPDKITDEPVVSPILSKASALRRGPRVMTPGPDTILQQLQSPSSPSHRSDSAKDATSHQTDPAVSPVEELQRRWSQLRPNSVAGSGGSHTSSKDFANLGDETSAKLLVHSPKSISEESGRRSYSSQTDPQAATGSRISHQGGNFNGFSTSFSFLDQTSAASGQDAASSGSACPIASSPQMKEEGPGVPTATANGTPTSMTMPGSFGESSPDDHQQYGGGDPGSLSSPRQEVKERSPRKSSLPTGPASNIRPYTARPAVHATWAMDHGQQSGQPSPQSQVKGRPPRKSALPAGLASDNRPFLSSSAGRGDSVMHHEHRADEGGPATLAQVPTLKTRPPRKSALPTGLASTTRPFLASAAPGQSVIGYDQRVDRGGSSAPSTATTKVQPPPHSAHPSSVSRVQPKTFGVASSLLETQKHFENNAQLPTGSQHVPLRPPRKSALPVTPPKDSGLPAMPSRPARAPPSSTAQSAQSAGLHRNHSTTPTPDPTPRGGTSTVETTNDLPPGWQALHDSRRNRTYYYHAQTGKSQWKMPKRVLPSGWIARVAERNGKTFYYHSESKTRQWAFPE